METGQPQERRPWACTFTPASTSAPATPCGDSRDTVVAVEYDGGAIPGAGPAGPGGRRGVDSNGHPVHFTNPRVTLSQVPRELEQGQPQPGNAAGIEFGADVSLEQLDELKELLAHKSSSTIKREDKPAAGGRTSTGKNTRGLARAQERAAKSFETAEAAAKHVHAEFVVNNTVDKLELAFEGGTLLYSALVGRTLAGAPIRILANLLLDFFRKGDDGRADVDEDGDVEMAVDAKFFGKASLSSQAEERFGKTDAAVFAQTLRESIADNMGDIDVKVIVAYDGLYRKSIKTTKDDPKKQQAAFKKVARHAIGHAAGGRLSSSRDCDDLVQAALRNRCCPADLWEVLCFALARALGAQPVFYKSEADNVVMRPLPDSGEVSLVYSADTDLGAVPGRINIRPVMKGSTGKKTTGKTGNFLVFKSTSALHHWLCSKTVSPELRQRLSTKMKAATRNELLSLRNFVAWSRLCFGNTDLRHHLGGNLVPHRSVDDFFAELWGRGCVDAGINTVFRSFSNGDLYTAGLEAVRALPASKLTRALAAALQEEGRRTKFESAVEWMFCLETGRSLVCDPGYVITVREDLQGSEARRKAYADALRKGETPARGPGVRASLAPEKRAFVMEVLRVLDSRLHQLSELLEKVQNAPDIVEDHVTPVSVKDAKSLPPTLAEIFAHDDALLMVSELLKSCSLPDLSILSFRRADAVQVAEEMVHVVETGSGEAQGRPFPGLQSADKQRRAVSQRQRQCLVELVADALMQARARIFLLDKLASAAQTAASHLGSQQVLDLFAKAADVFGTQTPDKTQRKWWAAMRLAGLFDSRELGSSAQAKDAVATFAETLAQFLFTLDEVLDGLDRAKVLLDKEKVNAAVAALVLVTDERLEILSELHSTNRGHALDAACRILAANEGERERLLEKQEKLLAELKEPTRLAFQNVLTALPVLTKLQNLLSCAGADDSRVVRLNMVVSSIERLFVYINESGFGIKVDLALALLPAPMEEPAEQEEDPAEGKEQKKQKKVKEPKKKAPGVQDTERELMSAPGALDGADPLFVPADTRAVKEADKSTMSATCVVERTVSAPLRSVVPVGHAAALKTHIEERQQDHSTRFEAEVLRPLRRLEGDLDVFVRVDLLGALGLDLERDGVGHVVDELLRRLSVRDGVEPRPAGSFAPLPGVTDEDKKLVDLAGNALDAEDFGRLPVGEIDNFFLVWRRGRNEHKLVWRSLYANVRECILRKLLAYLERIAIAVGSELARSKLKVNYLSAQVGRRLRRRLVQRVHQCVSGGRKLFEDLADADDADGEPGEAALADVVDEEAEDLQEQAEAAEEPNDDEDGEQEAAASLEDAIRAAEDKIAELVGVIDRVAGSLFSRLVPSRATRLPRGAKAAKPEGDQVEGLGAMATKARVHCLVPVVAVLGVIAAQVCRRAGCKRGALCLPAFDQERLAVRVDVGRNRSGIAQPADPAAQRAVLFLRALAPDGAKERRAGVRAVGERSRSVHANRNLLWTTAKVCRIRTRYSNPECEWTVPQMVAVMMGGRNVHDFYHPLSDKARVPSVNELNNAMDAFVQRGRRHEKGQPSFASRKPASEKALAAAVQRTLALGKQGVELQRTIVQRAVIVGIDDNVSGCVLGFFDCRTGRFWCVSVPAGLQREAGGEAEYRALSREVQRNHDDANADEILREIAVALRGRSRAAAASFANMVADFVRQISVMDKSDGAQARIPIVAWGDAHAGGTGKVGGHGTTGLGKSFVEALVARMPVFTVSEMRSSVCCAVTGTRMTQTAKWSRKARGDKSEVDRDRNAALNMCRRAVALLCGVGPPGHLRRAGACPAPRTGP